MALPPSVIATTSSRLRIYITAILKAESLVSASESYLLASVILTSSKYQEHLIIWPSSNTNFHFDMPIIPESSDFPSVPQKGDNQSEKKQTGETNPDLSAFNSKGPQIPNPNGK